MCLPYFIEFKQIEKSSPIIGYRRWRNKIYNSLDLISENQNYVWSLDNGPVEVTGFNSGFYSNNNNYYYNNNYYNNYNNYYNNYYNNNNNYYYNNNYYNNYNNYYNNNYNNYNNYNYYLAGIIKQWGKIAIHNVGYRSEFARIDKLFSIRESDAIGPDGFLKWINIFNNKIYKIAEKYKCEVVNYQDFKES